MYVLLAVQIHVCFIVSADTCMFYWQCRYMYVLLSVQMCMVWALFSLAHKLSEICNNTTRFSERIESLY